MPQSNDEKWQQDYDKANYAVICMETGIQLPFFALNEKHAKSLGVWLARKYGFDNYRIGAKNAGNS